MSLLPGLQMASERARRGVMDESSSIYSRFLNKAKAAPEPQLQPPVFVEPSVAYQPSGTKRLVVSATSKGGVGKSYVTINLCEWFRSLEVPFVAFDPDWCNSTLTRFFTEAEFIDISEAVHLDNVIRAFERTDLVLTDGVGSLQMKFIDWLEETRVFDLRKQLSLDITMLLIIEEDKETVFQAGQAAQRVGDRADWLVVRNLKTSPVTEIYDNSNARKSLLDLGAKEITLERLPWNLNSIIQKSSKSIGALVEDESIFFLERQRMRSYQQRLFDEFASAREYLLPGALIAPAPPEAEPEPEEPPKSLKKASISRPRVPPAEV
ncbi:MAG: hypothetical protein PHC88_10545 [Terrimicrobiaceae bacterium]|nr:hypothetical protein [Terrimicrobiaceae bacterium]